MHYNLSLRRFSLDRAYKCFKIIMSPPRAARGCPSWRNLEEQALPNAPEMQPQGEVTNIKFIEAIRMLS